MTSPSEGARSDTASGRAVPEWLRAFPGAVLELSADGTVRDSNGWLETAAGTSLVGRPFADSLDAFSSRDKWTRLLTAAHDRDEATVVELVLAGDATLLEPRTFSLLPSRVSESVWLVEHPHDVRLDRLRGEVTEVNSELTNTQRELVKERGRLREALAELERQHEALRVTSAELERSNAALDEFAHAVSHDLKAPLRGITNCAQWLEEDLGPQLGGEPREHLESLRRGAARMRTMIDGVLAYARAGREEARAENIDLRELVAEVLAMIQPPAGVSVTASDDMPTVHAPRAPLQQVVQNLIDNAIKHSGPHARVWVKARLDGAWCEVVVSDDGPGIPPEHRERIWGLFHRLTPSGDTESTGVGLALVRRLVEAQGGRVGVESREGGGATFRFTWPANIRE